MKETVKRMYCGTEISRENSSKPLYSAVIKQQEATHSMKTLEGLPKTMDFDDPFWMSAALLYLKTGEEHPSFKCHHKSVQRGIKRYAKELLEVQDYTGVSVDDNLFWEHAVEVYKQDGEKSVKFKKLSLGAKQLIRNKAAC